MCRLICALTLGGILAVFVIADEKSGEETMLRELKKLAGPIAKAEDRDTEDIKEEFEKRAKRALVVITTFEADFPKSKSLNDARLLALKTISHSQEMATAKDPLALAKRLREATEKGSDHAAQADMFVVGAVIRMALHGAKSNEDFAKAWNKNADAFRKRIATYLEDHPKYVPAADALRSLVPLLELADDEKTLTLILDSIAKNLPEHPLARAANLRNAVGKEFDVSFTPEGSDKPMSLKDLRGKVVVLNFWASWCQPCVAELKQLKALYEKHHKEGLEIVGFSLDEKDVAARRFITKNAIVWRQVVGKSARELGEKYGIESVPVQFVIDRDGKLHSAEALGKLPEMLPKLLEKK